MMIDKVGGINPSYSPRDPKVSHPKQEAVPFEDRVSISPEASRAAEFAQVINAIKVAEDPERSEKLRQVQENLANRKYDQLSKEQLNTITRSLMNTFFS